MPGYSNAFGELLSQSPFLSLKVLTGDNKWQREQETHYLVVELMETSPLQSGAVTHVWIPYDSSGFEPL